MTVDDQRRREHRADHPGQGAHRVHRGRLGLIDVLDDQDRERRSCPNPSPTLTTAMLSATSASEPWRTIAEPEAGDDDARRRPRSSDVGPAGGADAWTSTTTDGDEHERARELHQAGDGERSGRARDPVSAGIDDQRERRDELGERGEAHHHAAEVGEQHRARSR